MLYQRSSLLSHRHWLNSVYHRSLATPAAAVSPPSATLSQSNHPTLVHVPSLPLVGSMVSAYSGIPPIDVDNYIHAWRRQSRKYGPFYSLGVPGVGTGLHGTTYIIRDPHEMNKILQREPVYPSGLIEKEWPLVAWFERKRFSSKGLLGRGAEWKRLRSFMQKDLLAPASAREYLPAICAGAALSSTKAGEHGGGKAFERYMNYCAFDMFMSVMLGQPDDVMSEEDHANFLSNGVDGLQGVVQNMLQPLQLVAHKLGVLTPSMRRLYANLDTVHDIAQKRLLVFQQQLESGNISDSERNSYFAKLLVRQPDSDVTKEEMLEICTLLMLASADTTASKTGWNVIQLALNPAVQEQLREELEKAMQEEGSIAAVIANSSVPLLPAFVRETHRCTPAAGADIIKTLPAPMEVHGVTLPEGATVLFDSLTNHMDPELVDDPTSFKPERWFKEAVEARKGTPSSIIDHPIYAGPFSQGARRCPGSRVANLEVQAMISHLVLDWNIECSPNLHWKDIPSYMGSVIVPRFPDDMRLTPRSSK